MDLIKWISASRPRSSAFTAIRFVLALSRTRMAALRALRDREQRATGAGIMRLLSSHAMLHRLKLERSLDGHLGCVNTVSFTHSGDLLLSGSDDLRIIVWDWSTGTQRFSFEPGHRNNIFQARSMPHSNDKTIISCAADGQVRVSHLAEGGAISKRKLNQHLGRAHKLSILPDQPHSFFSCGEDGVVQLHDLRLGPQQAAQAPCKFTVSSMQSRGWRGAQQPLDLNAIHVNPSCPWLMAVGGDDQYARVYDIRCLPSPGVSGAVQPAALLCPEHLNNAEAEMHHITCVTYSCRGELLVTYHQEELYLFAPWGQEQGPGQAPRRKDSDEDEEEEEEVENEEDGDAEEEEEGWRGNRGSAASGSRAAEENGRQRRGQHGKADQGKDGKRNKQEGRSGRERGRAAARGGAGTGAGDGEAAGFWGGGGGGSGFSRSSLGGRLGTVLQSYSGHRNVQTVKGCNFFGASDEYVVSGSDCGHIFIWDRVSGSLQQLKHGDEHVVNCLEPHPLQTLVLATSGIGNDVKIWSPTAEEPCPPERAFVERVTGRNSRGRRQQHQPRVITLSPAMLLQLFEQRTAAVRRRREEDPAEDEGRPRGPQAVTAEEPEALDATLRMLRTLVGREEDESEEEESEEDESEEEEDEDAEGAGAARRRQVAGAGGGNDGDGEEEDEEEEDVPFWARDMRDDEEEEAAGEASSEGADGSAGTPGPTHAIPVLVPPAPGTTLHNSEEG